MKNHIEIVLEEKIKSNLPEELHNFIDMVFKDEEIRYIQEYANVVSIKRLGYNDHGPVHMRQVAANACKIASILYDSGIKFNLEKEEIGSYQDSMLAIFLAAFLHDAGMTVGREYHEKMSLTITYPIIDRLLKGFYKNDLNRLVIVRSMVLEGIAGHMANQKIHSIEAGIILVADGCDMQKGRARIPMMLNFESRVGDIHKNSSAAIEKVKISKGEIKPVRINIEMSESVGFFQVEEVLLGKISVSPIKSHVEVYAGVNGKDIKKYL
ncbi:MAG: phosphohydrolase [Candidatus Delongbacteria bacterium]|nr:phosphohydrolase [Candidatus Delongbacteria bacterium]MBN2836646.1 phosphohydrolase [Candidatus Delongbacteria bacterium]